MADSTRPDPNEPPVAHRELVATTLHGETLEDAYAWMRDKNSPDVLAYLAAENAWTTAQMADTAALQETLYREMLSHIQETDESVPYPDGAWLYWTRTVEGLQYPIHCRRARGGDGSQEMLLDVNALAAGQPYMAVGALTVSPDGAWLAYTTDNTGFRVYTLHVRELATGRELAETAERVGSVAWAADSTTLFYVTEDETTKRQNRLYRHRCGGGSCADDPLVFEETDERFNLGVGRSRDRQYLFVESGSHTTNEYRFLRADDPGGELVVLAPRIDEQEYHPEHRDGLFWLRTNDTTENFRLVAAPVQTPGREHWRELYQPAAETPLEDFDLFRSFCVLTERRAGLPTLTVCPVAGAGELGPGRDIPFPEPAYTAGAHANRDFDTDVFRYSYTSLVSPASVFEYTVATGDSVLLKEQSVPGGFDRTLYGSERLWVEAVDGVKVPVSLVYRRDRFRLHGDGPLYVYGYGSYGYPLPIGFSSTRLSLLDRGVVLAYAHVRGGGELGDAWHDAGKMHLKQNTFSDFIRVVEELVRRGYGGRDRVAIEGGSAGGLLMGAVVNQRPELFRAVLSHVPFVDVLNTMLDASLPLTVGEYEEWGNPNDAADFAVMRTYSPYENLRAGDYPAMLVKTSLHDSQVMFWEPAKYVSKLRFLRQNSAPLLLQINMEAGHGGASGRYDYLREIAFDHAFLLRELGATDEPAADERPAPAARDTAAQLPAGSAPEATPASPRSQHQAASARR